MKLFFYIALVVFLSNHLASAQLHWDQRQLEFSPGLTDTELTAQFSFSNPTDHSITITSIQSSCGCTTAELEKKIYLPGESGVLAVRFVFGDSTGDQKKTIAVQTDDPAESKVLLRLRAQIPALLKISPAYVFWKQNAPPEPREVILEVQDDVTMQVTDIKAQDPNLRIRWEVIRPDKSYRVIVTPQKTTDVSQAMLEISTDFPAHNPRIFHVYAVIVSPNRQLLAPASQPSRGGE